MALFRDPRFSRLNRTPTCDRQTNRHDDGKYSASSIASRGQKLLAVLPFPTSIFSTRQSNPLFLLVEAKSSSLIAASLDRKFHDSADFADLNDVSLDSTTAKTLFY